MKKYILILILGGVSILGCQNSNNEQTSSNSNSSAELPKDTISISTENSTTNFQIKITPEQEVLLNNLKVEKDEFKQVAFYEHKKQPKGWCNDVSLYIVREGEQMFGRLKIRYNAEDWLFIENVQFLCDDVPVSYISDTSWEHDNSGGEIFEYNDAVVTRNVRLIIEKIITSKKVKMRCNGDQYYDDRTLSENEKGRIKEVYSILYGPIQSSL